MTTIPLWQKFCQWVKTAVIYHYCIWSAHYRLSIGITFTWVCGRVGPCLPFLTGPTLPIPPFFFLNHFLSVCNDHMDFTIALMEDVFHKYLAEYTRFLLYTPLKRYKILTSIPIFYFLAWKTFFSPHYLNNCNKRACPYINEIVILSTLNR